MTRPPEPDFRHLLAMTDRRATFEHAAFARPRIEHGYCTDDMARVLVVTTRETEPEAAVCRLAELALRFLTDAQGVGGDYRNRMDRHGRFGDKASTEDCWGRSIWGLGTAAAHGHDEWLRHSATLQLERAARQRSPWTRAMAFAALGAAELLSVQPEHRAARQLLSDAALLLPLPSNTAGWLWPEERLRYANAVLPEALLAAGVGLERDDLTHAGLELLAWLLGHEMLDGHVSVTPVAGAGRHDVAPAFDQQPIEVAALADACARAASIDDDRRWVDGIAACAAWFTGENDGSVVMFDPDTGGGFDGLTAVGANLNEGAESTLALLATLQHARTLVGART